MFLIEETHELATRFLEAARQQLDPLYQQQTEAVRGQLPAIQQLYDTLLRGLEGQRQTETQNILESASQRGVLRSSLPVDLRTRLGEALLAQRGKLESQRAQDVSGVQEKLSNIGIQKEQAVAGLADALRQRDLQERDFQLRQQKADRDFQLAQQRLAAQTQAATRQPSAPARSADLQRQAFAAVAQSWKPGGDGYVSPEQWNQFRSQWAQMGFNVNAFDAAFGGLVNPVHAKNPAWMQYAGFAPR